MLNLFPIQFLAMLAYAVLRIFVGMTLIHLGLSHAKHRATLRDAFATLPLGGAGAVMLPIAETIIGLMFFFGFLTQLAALVGIALSLKFLILYRHLAHPLIPSRSFYFLLLGASLSLLVTGAGAFAIDLPI